MTIPEHVRGEVLRLLTLVEHHKQIGVQLEAELTKLLHTATGINITTEDATLDVQTMELKRAGGDAEPTA